MHDREATKQRLVGVIEHILDRSTSLTDPKIVAAAQELDIAVESLSIRRVEGIFLEAVRELREAIDTNVGSRANRRAVSDAAALIERLETVALTPDELRARLISTFDIVAGRGKVALDLGETSPYDFIHRANVVTEGCFGRAATHPYLLTFWARWPELGFMERAKPSTFIGVNCAVPGALRSSSERRESGRFDEVSLPALAVAHAAYWAVRGCDLFDGCAVRARNLSIIHDTPAGLQSYLGLLAELSLPLGGAVTMEHRIMHPSR